MSASQTIEIISHTRKKVLNLDLLSEESFQDHVLQYKHLPWLQKIKQEAWERFNALPMPKKEDENWRFSSRKNLDLDGFHLSQAPSESEQINILKNSNAIENFSGRLIFEDNHMLDHDYISDALEEKGVIWEPLTEAFERHPDLVKRAFAKNIPKLGSEKFFWLNIAYAHTGSFLYVPSGVEIENPFVVYHWANEKNSALFPQTIVIAEEGSSIQLVDLYMSHSEDSSGLSISLGSISAGPSAHVKRNTIQNWNDNTLSFQLDSLEVEKAAETQTVAVNLGSQYARFENVLSINGANAEADAYSLTLGNGNQEFDQRTHQNHRAPYAVSDLLYKNGLEDASKSIFSGMISVDELAQKTDAYQTNRNLLLSEDAEANALPGLEIKANDVKCSHGATSGKLDETELFYMQARGLSKEKARELLVFGFFEEILANIENEEIRNSARSLLTRKFSTIAAQK